MPVCQRMPINSNRCHQEGCCCGSCVTTLLLNEDLSFDFTGLIARASFAIAGIRTDSSDAKVTGLVIAIMLAMVCGGNDRGSLNVVATKLKPEIGADDGGGLGVLARVVDPAAAGPVKLWTTGARAFTPAD
jgi:hypothetical protein